MEHLKTLTSGLKAVPKRRQEDCKIQIGLIALIPRKSVYSRHNRTGTSITS